MTLQEAVEKLQKEASEIYYKLEKDKTEDALEYINPKIAVFDIAIDCIRKQIRKTPLNNGNYRCPICNRIFGAKLNYCPNCGQKIDWSGQK